MTHDHPEGVKGAQAVASAIFLARTGQSKDEIKNDVEKAFDHHLDKPLDEIRQTYEFHVLARRGSYGPSECSWNWTPGKARSLPIRY